MTAVEEVDSTTRAEMMDVYRSWWLHDARWYQGVAKRFGQQAANEVNAEALRYVATAVGRKVARHFGGKPARDMEELRLRYDACADRMFPHELRDIRSAVLDDEVVEIVIRQNFALTMVRMAGSTEGYECPCTEVHAGWSDGLGVALAENCSTGCLRHGDPACRLLMRIAPAEGD
ncbi:hypothetical protein [Umezawaea sp. Da 62-37]|uniref:hypothetical protein n=1 Tax=Umezawaea sp. Da 62-37 TaxID=3075927 RepID=UPI0028F72FAB|nr:hypothetical protein [Umezawaea sp. Da 62-37]WNV88098.1 hypothetical protein RM788_07350 [Umezawaea sp. Da 62-37]